MHPKQLFVAIGLAFSLSLIAWAGSTALAAPPDDAMVDLVVSASSDVSNETAVASEAVVSLDASAGDVTGGRVNTPIDLNATEDAVSEAMDASVSDASVDASNSAVADVQVVTDEIAVTEPEQPETLVDVDSDTLTDATSSGGQSEADVDGDICVAMLAECPASGGDGTGGSADGDDGGNAGGIATGDVCASVNLLNGNGGCNDAGTVVGGDGDGAGSGVDNPGTGSEGDGTGTEPNITTGDVCADLGLLNGDGGCSASADTGPGGTDGDGIAVGDACASVGLLNGDGGCNSPGGTGSGGDSGNDTNDGLVGVGDICASAGVMSRDGGCNGFRPASVDNGGIQTGNVCADVGILNGDGGCTGTGTGGSVDGDGGLDLPNACASLGVLNGQGGCSSGGTSGGGNGGDVCVSLGVLNGGGGCSDGVDTGDEDDGNTDDGGDKGPVAGVEDDPAGDKDLSSGMPSGGRSIQPSLFVNALPSTGMVTEPGDATRASLLTFLTAAGGLLALMGLAVRRRTT